MTKDEYSDLFHKTQANLVAFKPLMECDDAVIKMIETAVQEEQEACVQLLKDFSETTMLPAKDTWRAGVVAAMWAVDKRGQK